MVRDNDAPTLADRLSDYCKRLLLAEPKWSHSLHTVTLAFSDRYRQNLTVSVSTINTVTRITFGKTIWISHGIRWRPGGDSNPQNITNKISTLKSPVLIGKHGAFIFTYISMKYRSIWRPQGDSTLSPSFGQPQNQSSFVDSHQLARNAPSEEIANIDSLK